MELIRENLEDMHKVVAYLLEKETITGGEIVAIIQGRDPALVEDAYASTHGRSRSLTGDIEPPAKNIHIVSEPVSAPQLPDGEPEQSGPEAVSYTHLDVYKRQDLAVGVDAVGAHLQHPLGKAGLHPGDQNAALIGELVGGVDHGVEVDSRQVGVGRRERQGKHSFFTKSLKDGKTGRVVSIRPSGA